MTIGAIGGLIFVLIAYGEWRYRCGRKDERRESAISAAQWVREGRP